MIRVCPKRDAQCPHGMACPYTVDQYHCADEPNEPAMTSQLRGGGPVADACPHCGKSRWVKVLTHPGIDGGAFGFVVRCSAAGAYAPGEEGTRGCGAAGGWGETEAEAIAAWNTRAPPGAEAISAPEGWVSVPREPTEAMIEACVDFMSTVSLGGAYRWPDYARDVYRCHLDNAPAASPPSPSADARVVELETALEWTYAAVDALGWANNCNVDHILAPIRTALTSENRK